MTTFYPDKFIKKVIPKGFFKENLLTGKDFSLKKKAMQGLILANVVDKKDLTKTVLNVAKVYKHKVDTLEDGGFPKVKANVLARGSEKLLKQRIESLIVYSEVLKLKADNKGSYYKWLPSGADEPSPQHQLLYGKTFLVGEGDEDGNMPGERYGCQCGMEILNGKETT